MYYKLEYLSKLSGNEIRELMEKNCRFGHICTSRCGNDIDCPCQSEHCCAFTEDCEGVEHCDDHYQEPVNEANDDYSRGLNPNNL